MALGPVAKSVIDGREWSQTHGQVDRQTVESQLYHFLTVWPWARVLGKLLGKRASAYPFVKW